MKRVLKSLVSIILCVCVMMPALSLCSFAAKLGQVKNLKATSNAATSISLKWDKVSGATGYRVYMYNSSQKKWVYEKSTSKTTVTVSDLTSAKAYKFRVRAYKGSKTKTFGSYSASVATATTPTQLKNLKASGITEISLTLSWSKVSRATGYRLYVYDASASSWKKIGNTTATKCKISGLTAGKTYKFKAYAYFNNGTKDFAGKYSSILTVASKPGKVSNLTVMSNTQNSITLAWNKVNGANQYQVYKYTGDTWKKVSTVKTNSCTLSATKKAEKYKVRACVVLSDSTVYGDYSSTISASAAEAVSTKVTAPKNLALSANTSRKCIDMSWTPSSGATGYQIEVYDYDSALWKSVGTSSSASYSYYPSANDEYYFRVRAFKTVNSKTYYSDYTPASGITYIAPSETPDLSFLEKYGIIGYMYDFEAGCFYNTIEPPHRLAGFSPVYDVFGPVAICFYDTVRIDFTYAGLDWRIQLWKGQYGWCFIGGEAGVYTKKAGALNVLDLYACASDENMLQMSMVVYHNGNKLFTRPYDYYWWCTGYVFGINPGALGSVIGAPDTSALTMLLRITLKSSSMTTLFCKALEKEGFKPGTDYVVSGNDVVLTWN